MSLYASQSEHIIDMTFLPQGLHDTPAVLTAALAENIARVEAQEKNRPDAILLGYGLCSNGVVGLKSGTIPLVVPRTDDCIAVFLGSQKRYKKLFDEYNPVYWVNNGWLERSDVPTKENQEKLYLEYCEKYDEDNADYLMEQDALWIAEYRTCGYIASDAYESPAYRGTARDMAALHGWELAEIEGDSAMMRRMVAGDWREDEVLVCPPGHGITQSYDDAKLKAVPAEEL